MTATTAEGAAAEVDARGSAAANAAATRDTTGVTAATPRAPGLAAVDRGRGTPGAVRASAHVVASLDAHGRTRPPRLRSDPPLVLRRTGQDTVHLVSVGAGPVAGDHLVLRIRVEAGARLTVRQLAASVALPSPVGDEPSRFELQLDVADGAHLTWWGEPTVGAARCHHETRVRVHLRGDASLRLVDEVISGRHGETGGVLRNQLTVLRDDEVVLRTDDRVGGPHWASPAVGGGARICGTALIAGVDAAAVPDLAVTAQHPAPDLATEPPPSAAVTAATFHLDDLLTAVSVLGDDHPTVRARLSAAVGQGHTPAS